MKGGFQIRAAKRGDIEEIYALDHSIKSVPHWAIADYLSALEPATHKADEFGTSRCLFVAESEGRLAGFAVGKVAVTKSTVLSELESVGVAESARRSGIGRALCAAVIEWSRRLDAREIELEVRTKSAGPITLYTGLGFVAVGLRKNYYRVPADDAVLMRLILAPANLAARP